MRWPLMILVCWLAVSTVGAQYGNGTQESAPFYPWPEGRRAAVSLTFDDARPSQLDHGIPILDRHGVRATFYVNPEPMRSRLSEWKAAVERGHEIGNHTKRHPCTGNFRFARPNALENHTLDTIGAEIDEAGREIEVLLGFLPRTFAFPCGQTFVGRGRDTRSYVPVVAERFVAGRGWLDEGPNDPRFCDLSQLLGMELDGLGFDAARELVDRAHGEGSWLILCGHDVGPGGRQTVRTDTLEALARYLADPVNGVWVAPVLDVAEHILGVRRQPDAGQSGLNP